MKLNTALLLLVAAFLVCSARALEQQLVPTTTTTVSRRQAIGGSLAAAVSIWNRQQAAWAADEDTITSTTTTAFNFEGRDRKGNKDAVIRDDYWFMMGKTPPRLLTAELKGDNPQWNAFGTCEQAAGGGSNSCTYVALSQRIPAYTKYGPTIAYGASEFEKLGVVLRQLSKQNSNNALWQEAASYVALPEDKQLPPGPVDAELKLVLFATAMTTSPNFPQPGKELLVARFYANECRHANREILAAIQERNLEKGLEAWKFGRDSWNSYMLVVNKYISPKVGDKFVPVSVANL